MDDRVACLVIGHQLPFLRIEDQRFPFLTVADLVAGSFKVEGLGISLFRRVLMDDPTALEGLPLIRLTDSLQHFGLAVLAGGHPPRQAIQ